MDKLIKHIKEYFNTFNNKDYTIYVDGTPTEKCEINGNDNLVASAEELEPYRVETGGYNKFRIKKGNLEYSYFPFGEHCVLSMDEAKAAAEAERDRLNAEHRKEQQLYINPIYDCDYGDHIGYEIAHTDGATEVIIYGGKNNMRTLEEAKAAAEEERKRLINAWRK